MSKNCLKFVHFSIFEKKVIKIIQFFKLWKGCGEKGTLLHCWWECKFIQPLWRTVRRFFKTLGIKLPYDPAILLLGMCCVCVCVPRWGSSGPCHPGAHSPSQEIEVKQVMTSPLRIMERNPQRISLDMQVREGLLGK